MNGKRTPRNNSISPNNELQQVQGDLQQFMAKDKQAIKGELYQLDNRRKEHQKSQFNRMQAMVDDIPTQQPALQASLSKMKGVQGIYDFGVLSISQKETMSAPPTLLTTNMNEGGSVVPRLMSKLTKISEIKQENEENDSISVFNVE